MQNTSAWGGRFEKETAELARRFGASVPFDWRLYRYDIAGSIAHARMLAKQNIIEGETQRQIEAGLVKVLRSIESGSFDWSIEREDVHMNVESALGDVGRSLHTARSRNDQVALDLRLYTRDAIVRLCRRILEFQAVLLERATANADTLMPGYTHLQRAQPISLGHHLLAYFEMLQRDLDRLLDAFERVNVLPLGAGALAGVPYPIDRQFVADQLGFARISANSIDAVADRDFVVECLSAATLCGIHLSRLSEELVLWSSAEFRYVEMDDAYSTGSSIMPQKKNPDFAELVRGKSGRLLGHLVTLLTVLKGLPLAYNKDLQEDKEPLFDAVDTLADCLEISREMVATLRFNVERMAAAAAQDYTTATDLADYLVKKGMPFRDAHRVVGEIVGRAVAAGRQLSDLDLAQLQQGSSLFVQDALTVLQSESSVNARNVPGGTAVERVRGALKEARRQLDDHAKRVNQLDEVCRKVTLLLESASRS